MRLKGDLEIEMLIGKGSSCCFALGQTGQTVSGLHEISRIHV
jgi:hypothetical protein